MGWEPAARISISTTLTVGADGLEASRASTITSSPQVPGVTRSITTRDSAKRVTKATLQTDTSHYVYSQYLFDSAGRIQRQWGQDSGATAPAISPRRIRTNAYTYRRDQWTEDRRQPAAAKRGHGRRPCLELHLHHQRTPGDTTTNGSSTRPTPSTPPATSRASAGTSLTYDQNRLPP